MILHAEETGGAWVTSNESRAYRVSKEHLDVFELDGAENILHQCLIWSEIND